MTMFKAKSDIEWRSSIVYRYKLTTRWNKIASCIRGEVFEKFTHFTFHRNSIDVFFGQSPNANWWSQSDARRLSSFRESLSFFHFSVVLFVLASLLQCFSFRQEESTWSIVTRNYDRSVDGSAIDAFWEVRVIELEKYLDESSKKWLAALRRNRHSMLVSRFATIIRGNIALALKMFEMRSCMLEWASMKHLKRVNNVKTDVIILRRQMSLLKKL